MSSGLSAAYRVASASISACIRALYSSDHSAPGFCLAFLSGGETDGLAAVLVGVGLRAPALSLSVGRAVEIELFMRLSGGLRRSHDKTMGPMKYRTIVLRNRDGRTALSDLSPRNDRNHAKCDK